MTADELIAAQLGVLTRAMLRRVGVTDYRIASWLASGDAVAVRRSVIAMRDAPPALVRAAGLGGKVACVSAARLYGLWVVDDGCFHVTVRTNQARGRADTGIRLHWQTRPLDAAGGLFALESASDMLAHVASCQPVDLAVAVFDSALNQGYVTAAELDRLAAHAGKRVEQVVSLTSALADSGLESLTRARLTWAGLRCREQVMVDGHPVDLMIGRVIIQLDGSQHLKDAVQLARDRAQDRRLKRLGFTVLRYGYADVVHHWDRTFREIMSFVPGAEKRVSAR